MSVIIPVYNRAGTIEHAVRSVIEQTEPVLEVIVVDDGSTDETAATVALIADPRVRYVHQPNGGAGSARNRGLDIASGEWIGFLDSDDWWTSQRVASAKKLIDAAPSVEVQQSNRLHVYPDGRIEGGVKASRRRMEDPMELASGFIMKTSAVMIKRELIERHNLRFPTDQKTCEDYHLFWRAVIFAQCIGFSETPDVMIRALPDSLSRANSGVYLQCDNIKTLIEVRRWARTKQASPTYVNSFASHLHWQFRDLFLMLLQHGRLKMLMRYVLLAVREEGSLRVAKGLISAFKGVCAPPPVGLR